MNNKKILALITGLCADLSEITGIGITLVYVSEKNYIYLTVVYSPDADKFDYDVRFSGAIHMEGNELYSPEKLLEAANKLKMLTREYKEK